jgi:hypothetical protein
LRRRPRSGACCDIGGIAPDVHHIYHWALLVVTRERAMFLGGRAHAHEEGGRGLFTRSAHISDCFQSML